MSLNREHAHASDGVAMLRAIRAAFSQKPDPVLVDASSDSGGVDTASRVSRANLEASADEVASRWMKSFGGG